VKAVSILALLTLAACSASGRDYAPRYGVHKAAYAVAYHECVKHHQAHPEAFRMDWARIKANCDRYANMAARVCIQNCPPKPAPPPKMDAHERTT
jgi:hypothetical protein